MWEQLRMTASIHINASYRTFVPITVQPTANELAIDSFAPAALLICIASYSAAIQIPHGRSQSRGHAIRIHETH